MDQGAAEKGYKKEKIRGKRLKKRIKNYLNLL
jgi:hypothetical protein